MENAINNTINWYGEAEEGADKRIKHYSHMLSRYYKKNGIMDEEFVHPGERLSGLPVRKLILRVIEKTGASVQDTVSAFLNQYYLGYSTLSFRKGAGELGCYSHAGEQSYKCVVHEFVVPVYFLYRYTQYFPEDMVQKMKQVLLNVTEKIYKKHGIKFEKNDFEMYSLGADENIYDKKSILVHSTENMGQGMNELVEKGYILEEFVSTTPNLTDISFELFERSFLEYCTKCQEKLV